MSKKPTNIETNGRATLKDVYAVVNRLEDKMDDVLKTHQEKIDKLENNQAKMFGGILVVGVLWQWIINQIIK